MHPSQLSDQLVERYPDLKQAKPSQVHSYASYLLRLATHGNKKHKRAGKGSVPVTAQSIHFERIRNDFGAEEFARLNAITGCILQTPNWSVEGGETRGYWLSDTGREVIELSRLNALKGLKNVLLDNRGNLIRRRANGVFTSRDMNRRNAVTDAFTRWAVPVNLPAIEHALEIGVQRVFPGLGHARTLRVDSELRAIHACALNEKPGYGLLPQEYKESEAGRLYGFGGLSLQNVTRQAKGIVLYGSHEYDLANCHYRLLIEASIQGGFDAPIMREYVNAPAEFRQSLANDIGITVKQAKKCLLALLYGAKRSEWHSCAIPELIGSGKAGQLYRHPVFDELVFEVVQAGQFLRERAPRLPNGAVVNCRSKSCVGSPEQEIAHILQGIESDILHQAIDGHGEYVLLLQHDGFTLSHYIDPREIEAVISSSTGYEMPVKHEQLAPPGLMSEMH